MNCDSQFLLDCEMIVHCMTESGENGADMWIALRNSSFEISFSVLPVRATGAISCDCSFHEKCEKCASV